MSDAYRQLLEASGREMADRSGFIDAKPIKIFVQLSL
jgi:hypothetical protein